MKLLRTIALISATACIVLTGCEKKPSTVESSNPPPPPKVVDEKTALANFKTEVETVGKWIEEKQKTASDPASGMAVMGEVIAKLKAIKTDGLPADLKGAWNEMASVLSEMGEIFKAFPAKGAKPEDAMKAMGEVMPKMMAAEQKMEPIAKKLQELGTKYGLDMSKVAPGK